MALSFERDIRPMFRDTDVATMQDYGLDLSSYAEVKNMAQAIYATLAEGTMPCDGACGQRTALRLSSAGWMKGWRCKNYAGVTASRIVNVGNGHWLGVAAIGIMLRLAAVGRDHAGTAPSGG